MCLRQIILLVFLLFSGIKSNAQWMVQESGTSRLLWDVCIVDSLHGWIVGEKATILATTDGGENWTRQTSPVDTIELNKIEFVDTDNGFIVGDKGLFLNTIDGGDTWEIVENSFEYNFSDLSFIGAYKGWVSGWQETPEERIGVILYTDDRGETWTKQIEIIADYLYGSTLFKSIQFWDENNGWAFGGDYAGSFSDTYVYYTANGGSNWEIIGSIPTTMRELKIASQNTLWGSKNQFYFSADGGFNWMWDSDFNNPIMGAISPIDSLRGWIFTYDNNSNKRTVWRTLNGGKSWINDLEIQSYIEGMDTYGMNYLWAVGGDGLIMKRVGNITSVKNNPTHPCHFELHNNYPNPFNPSTTIRYSIPKQSHVELIVYDILGKEVASLVNEGQPSGTYEVHFDPNNMNSGVYFYKIIVGGFVETRKMLFLK